MPRISSKTKTASARVPRRQVERRVSAAKSKIVKEENPEEKITVAERKAPTNLYSPKEGRKKISKKVFLISFTVVACLVLAIFVGQSGDGQIDTASKISENAKQIANSNQGQPGGSTEEIVPPPVVPVSKLKGRKVGTENVTQPVPSEVNAESLDTSTSTDTASTSKDAEEKKNSSLESEVTELETEEEVATSTE